MPVPTEVTQLQWFATLGVGGVIAAFMFLLYRKDSKEWRDRCDQQAASWKGQAEMLVQVVKENTASNTAVIKSVEANTRMVESMHVRMDQTDRGRRGTNREN